MTNSSLSHACSSKACVSYLLTGADRGGGLGRRRQHQLWGVHHHALQGEHYRKHRSSDWCNILNIYGIWGIKRSLGFKNYTISFLHFFSKSFWVLDHASRISDPNLILFRNLTESLAEIERKRDHWRKLPTFETQILFVISLWYIHIQYEFVDTLFIIDFVYELKKTFISFLVMIKVKIDYLFAY